MATALRSGWLWWAISVLLGLHCAIDLRLLPDSRDYIETAGYLASGAGFVTHVLDAGTRIFPDPRLHHPPVYGSFLALLQWAGLSALPALRTATALCFVGTAVLVWFLIRRLAGLAMAPAVMALFLALEMLYEPWTYAMSEAPFQVLSAATLLWLVRNPRPRPGAWAIAGVLAGLATLCRWIGFGLPVAAAVWLWPRRKRKESWMAMIALAVGYTLVTGPWLARNAMVAGRLTGKVSEPSHIPPWLNLVAFSRTLLLDLLPVLAVLLLAYAAGRRLGFSRPARLLLAWGAVYSIVLLTMSSISFIDPINTRLTLPVYVALIPVCAAQALRMLGPLTLRPPVIAVAAGLLTLAGLFQVVNGRRRAALDPISVSSPLTAWMAGHTPPGSLIVNPSGAPVYFPEAGNRYTLVRFFHLNDMDPAAPGRFLERFPGQFPALFLVLPADSPSLPSWEAAWLLETAGEVPAAGPQPWRIYSLRAR